MNKNVCIEIELINTSSRTQFIYSVEQLISFYTNNDINPLDKHQIASALKYLTDELDYDLYKDNVEE